jgi:hypothetical protein
MDSSGPCPERLLHQALVRHPGEGVDLAEFSGKLAPSIARIGAAEDLAIDAAMWKMSVCVHDCGGTPKNMACRTRHGAGVRGSAQRPHVAPRPARRPAAADGGGSGRSPSPRQDRCRRRPAAGVRPAGRTASRSARGWGGVRKRGGQPGAGRRWRGCHGKRGFIFPILGVFLGRPSPSASKTHRRRAWLVRQGRVPAPEQYASNAGAAAHRHALVRQLIRLACIPASIVAGEYP